MILKRIDPLSCGKVMGLLSVVVGLIFGVLHAATFGIIQGFLTAMSGEFEMLPVGPFFGIGMVVVMPITYGIFGFLSGLIGSVIYNLVARAFSGIRIELVETHTRMGEA